MVSIDTEWPFENGYLLLPPISIDSRQKSTTSLDMLVSQSMQFTTTILIGRGGGGEAYSELRLCPLFWVSKRASAAVWWYESFPSNLEDMVAWHGWRPQLITAAPPNQNRPSSLVVMSVQQSTNSHNSQLKTNFYPEINTIDRCWYTDGYWSLAVKRLDRPSYASYFKRLLPDENR